MVGIRRVNGVMGKWDMSGLRLVRVRGSVSGRDRWWTWCGSVHMLEMLVVDRKMGIIRLVCAIRIRSSACPIGRPRCHSGGSMRRRMAIHIQAVVWCRLGVLLGVPIMIWVWIIITWVLVRGLLVGHRYKEQMRVDVLNG